MLASTGCSSALIDPPDGGDSAVVTGDTGTTDTSVSDTGGGMDTGVSDTGVADTGTTDTGTTDTGTMDTGTTDAGPPTPGEGELVISELMPDSDVAGDSLGEWFELHNPSTTITYSLDGCSFYDSGGAVERPTGVLIAPGEYVSFAISASPGFTPDYVYTSGMRLANPPDPDSLTVACGITIVDAVAYLPYPTWPWGQGESLNLDPSNLDAADNDLQSSWCEGTTVYAGSGSERDRGTPGAANVDCP